MTLMSEVVIRVIQGHRGHLVVMILQNFQLLILIHFFFGGGGRIRVLKTKVAKFATTLFVFHFPEI